MPVNSYDQRRLQILSMPDEQLKVMFRSFPPTINDIEGHNFHFCYIYYNPNASKGWRSDPWTLKWNCKGHWGKTCSNLLRRKIDKISIDKNREFHRWATELNHSKDEKPFRKVLVEYFIKDKSVLKSYGTGMANDGFLPDVHPLGTLCLPKIDLLQEQVNIQASSSPSSSSSPASPQSIGSESDDTTSPSQLMTWSPNEPSSFGTGMTSSCPDSVFLPQFTLQTLPASNYCPTFAQFADGFNSFANSTMYCNEPSFGFSSTAYPVIGDEYFDKSTFTTTSTPATSSFAGHSMFCGLQSLSQQTIY